MLEESHLHQIWVSLNQVVKSLWAFTILLGALCVPAQARDQAPTTTTNVFQQQQVVSELGKQVDAQQKVLADLNSKMSEQNQTEQSTHINEIQQSIQSQAAAMEAIQRQISDAKVSGNDSYLNQADQIQKNRVDREQSIKSVQGQLQQQRQVVASLQAQLQAQQATNVDSDLLDYFQQATAEQQGKLSELEDLNRSLQVEAGQSAVGEEFVQTQQQAQSRDNVQALQGQYQAAAQRYEQLQSQYQSALNDSSKAQDQLSHLEDQYDLQRETYLALQEKYSNAQTALQKTKAASSAPANSNPSNNSKGVG
jgi:chromosome segregation ATPase